MPILEKGVQDVLIEANMELNRKVAQNPLKIEDFGNDFKLPVEGKPVQGVEVNLVDEDPNRNIGKIKFFGADDRVHELDVPKIKEMNLRVRPNEPNKEIKVFVVDEEMIHPQEVPVALVQAERGFMMIGIEEAVVKNGHEYEVDARKKIYIGGIDGHVLQLGGKPGEFYVINLADINWPVVRGPIKKVNAVEDLFDDIDLGFKEGQNDQVEDRGNIERVGPQDEPFEDAPLYFVNVDYGTKILTIRPNPVWGKQEFDNLITIDILAQPLEALICTILNAIEGDRVAIIED